MFLLLYEIFDLLISKFNLLSIKSFRRFSSDSLNSAIASKISLSTINKMLHEYLIDIGAR